MVNKRDDETVIDFPEEEWQDPDHNPEIGDYGAYARFLERKHRIKRQKETKE
jgi:hypothetical protein